ncbi:calcium-activated chloride channel regulator 1-like [Phlebotomus papatasi]|uniref:calcium-activated chloride channel regulator 1-like n=1 Tax=Phlebotomus papatasi TaxID=29031 RepID=UPI0024834245|nr:calcium-activated chloride channel regulator 1-like [Phlebotomus papatasi]
MFKVLIVFITVINFWPSLGITITKSAYRDVVVKIEESVTREECVTILTELEASLASASQFLFSALDGRAYFGDITVLIPNTWPDVCLPPNRTFTTSSGERSDITLTSIHPIHGEAIWTQQAGGCGEAGEQIFMSYTGLNRGTFAKEFVREWAKYRYGVFDERGFARDPVYPKCFMTDKRHVTGCSDSPINTEGICEDNLTNYNISTAIDPNSRTSIMYAAEASSVVMFCDEGNHNKFAPTKHNHLCGRQSTLDVILKHTDFVSSNIVSVTSPSSIVNTHPIFTYKKRTTTRYVIVIDETQDMQIRESWSFLRNAIRKWVVYDLPRNTEVGVVLANDTAADKILPISSLMVPKTRDLVASFIPYSPNDSRQPACINCAIRDAIRMLRERSRLIGPASNVILVIAPGMDYNTDHHSLSLEANSAKIRIVTVNYPGVIRRQPLDILAAKTDGSSFTIMENKYNGEKTFLSTYFELTNILFHIGTQYYEGNPSDLPVEIHRKELVDIVEDANSAKRISRLITGSFMLDNSMGVPSSFFVYTHNGEHPLIHSLKLISPNGVVYSTKSDSRLSVKQLMIPATINETGTWTYTIERFNGNPQPHYVQVMVTPRSTDAAVIRAKAWIKRSFQGGPYRLFAEVKKGLLPVLSALVEVRITRLNIQCNATVDCFRNFKLLDTGSGDPDVTRGDGIYSRYFSSADMGVGSYKLEVTVTDNGNTAYSLADEAFTRNLDGKGQPCCGSVIPVPSKQPLPPFQRVLPAITIFVTKEQSDLESKEIYGRIGDLKAEVLEGMKVRLSWTSPDLGGLNVARYEVKYATSIEDIVNNYETAAIMWTHDQPFAFSIGDETSFILNMTTEPELIGQPLYFAIRAYAQLSKDALASQVSNYVRVFVSRPSLPSTAPPNYATDGIYSSWPFGNESDNSDNIIPRIAQSINIGLELIIPIIGGIILLIVLIFIYCYCSVAKRRSGGGEKKKTLKQLKNENNLVNVIVPSPVHQNHQNNMHTEKALDNSTLQNYEALHDVQDLHTVGVPIYSLDDDLRAKNRYSLVHHQEQQLIEELKQTHHMQREIPVTLSGTYGPQGLSIISTSNTLGRNGRTLSPYESWTASQLLTEHERRHSPTDELLMPNGNTCIDGLVDHVPPNDQMLLLNHNRSDCVSLSGSHMAPPVPPLPYSDYQTQTNYVIYGRGQNQPPPMYSVVNRNNTSPGAAPPQQFGVNSSLQGSLNSVNSSERKRRNVTMV